MMRSEACSPVLSEYDVRERIAIRSCPRVDRRWSRALDPVVASLFVVQHGKCAHRSGPTCAVHARTTRGTESASARSSVH